MRGMVKRQNPVDNIWMDNAWHFLVSMDAVADLVVIDSGKQIVLHMAFKATLPLPCKNGSNPN